MFVRTRLSVMMFLEFFIWGAWLPQIFAYLGDGSLNFNWWQQALIMNAFSVASIAAMFFSNQFADRNFAAEKFVAVSHFIGGVAILALAWVDSFWPFLLLMLVHTLFYVPTISITNSIAFTHVKDPRRDFGLVRLWGTIGWIAAAWPFVFILADWADVKPFGSVSFKEWLGSVLGSERNIESLRDAKTWMFIASGVASFVLAGFSLTLPHTPPKPATGIKQFALLSAMQLLLVPFVFVLFVVTFFDSAVHTCYFIFTEKYLKSVGVPSNWIMPAMSIGQVAEILTMAILALFLKRFGWRTTMIIGILGHAARFAVFALVPNAWVAVTINVLHGICYAFFFATVYIFVDEFFPKDARSSAQGLFNFLILGFGPLVGYFVWPLLGTYLFNDKLIPFRYLFLVPSAVACFAALLLLLFFRPPARADQLPAELP